LAGASRKDITDGQERAAKILLISTGLYDLKISPATAAGPGFWILLPGRDHQSVPADNKRHDGRRGSIANHGIGNPQHQTRWPLKGDKIDFCWSCILPPRSSSSLDLSVPVLALKPLVLLDWTGTSDPPFSFDKTFQDRALQ
jgi:hypothetical protein